jgi:hypothetical protein
VEGDDLGQHLASYAQPLGGFDYGYRLPPDLTETNGAHRFSFAYLF